MRTIDEDEIRFQISANGAGPPAPMNVGEIVEYWRQVLLVLSELMPGVEDGWRFTPDSFNPPGRLRVTDRDAFAQMVLSKEEITRSVVTRGSPSVTNEVGERVELGLDAFTTIGCGFEAMDPSRRIYVGFSNRKHTRLFKLKSGCLSVGQQRQIGDEIRKIGEFRYMKLGRSSEQTVKRMKGIVRAELERRRGPLDFVGESYFFGQPIQPELPSSASQSINDGYLRILGPELGALDSPEMFEATTEIALAIAQNSALTGRLAGIPDRLFDTFPLEGVPIFRHDNKEIEPLYWVIEGALQRPLISIELDRLHTLAERQAALDVPGPINWLVEQSHVYEQLGESLAEFSSRIAITQLGPERILVS